MNLPRNTLTAGNVICAEVRKWVAFYGATPSVSSVGNLLKRRRMGNERKG